MYYFESINLSLFYFLLLVTCVFFLFFYHRSLLKINYYYRILLLGLRLITLVILICLLFSPKFIIEKNDNKSKISFLIDNSKSIKKSKSTKLISESISNFEIANKEYFKVDYFVFGDSLRNIKNSNMIDFNDNSTNYFDLFKKIKFIDADEFILISDGVQTEGFTYNHTLLNDDIIHTWGVGKYKPNEDISILNCIIDTIYTDNLDLKLIIKSNLLNDELVNININNDDFDEKIYNAHIVSGDIITEYKINVKKKYFLNENIINITSNVKEKNLNNNYYRLSLELNDLKIKKILLLSGNLSINTRKIKNIINNDNIDHFFKINESNWNKDISILELSDYDMIFLDNFPLNNQDSLLAKKNNYFKDYRFVYFSGYMRNTNLNTINDFLGYYNYNINIDDKLFENSFNDLSLINNESIYSLISKLPKTESLISVKSKIKKYHTISYSNGNIAIDMNSDKLFIFLPNITSLSNQVLNIYQDDIYSDLLKYYINKIKNSNDIRIYSLKSLYDINENCIISFKSIPGIKKINLVVDDILNLSKKKYNHSVLENNTHNIKVNLDSVSEYKLQLFIELDNGLKLESNILNLKSQLLSDEIKNINFDEYTLKSIANDTKGKYIHMNNIDEFINSYQFKVKNKIVKIRYDIFSFRNYWLLLIITLLLEWYIRKNRGLL